MRCLPRPLVLALCLACTGWLSACGDAPPMVRHLSDEDRPLTMRLSPNLDQVLMGTVHNGVSLWRWEDRQILATLNHRADQPSDVVATAFSADGRHAVTAERQTVVHWDLANQRSVGFWSTEGLVRAVDVSRDGRHVLVGLSTREAWLIDSRANMAPAVIPHADAVGVVRLAPDGKLGATGADDGMLRVWDLEKGVSLLTWKFTSPLATVVFSDDLSLVFAAPFHGPGRMWRLSDGKVLHEQLGERRTSLASARFSADGKRLVTGSPSGEVRLWSVKTGQQLQRWQVPKPELVRPSGIGVMDVAFSTDNQSITAALSNGSVVSWPK